MTNYVRRLVYIDEAMTKKVNPLFYPFLFASFIYGFGFTFFGWWSGVSTSSLFQALANIHPFLPHAWGIAALAAAVFATALVLLRKRGWMGETASMFGVLVWLFAAFVYLLNGFWLVLFSITIPNIFFWTWYYTRVKWYERQLKAGLLKDAG